MYLSTYANCTPFVDSKNMKVSEVDKGFIIIEIQTQKCLTFYCLKDSLWQEKYVQKTFKFYVKKWFQYQFRKERFS